MVGWAPGGTGHVCCPAPWEEGVGLAAGQLVHKGLGPERLHFSLRQGGRAGRPEGSSAP